MGLRPLIIALFMIFLFVPSIVHSQNIETIDITATGTCKDFLLTVNTNLDGCWDVKIDTPGAVQHPEGWKSSFFYVNDAVCGNGSLRVRFSGTDNIQGEIKLRQENNIFVKPFSVVQNCPPEFSDTQFLLFMAFIAALFLTGILWYGKR